MIHLPKSYPPPESLQNEKSKANGSYLQKDVLDRLRDDFKNKCYLCEEAGITSINVEHFVPHKDDKDLIFDWDNLFFSCHHCNNSKGTIQNILDCTKDELVETKIRYQVRPFENSKILITPNVDDDITHNTVALLNKIHFGNTHLKTIAAENLTDKIVADLTDFLKIINDYFEEDDVEKDREKLKNRIISHLRASSNFTAFKRWAIRDEVVLMNEFGQYF